MAHPGGESLSRCLGVGVGVRVGAALPGALPSAPSQLRASGSSREDDPCEPGPLSPPLPPPGFLKQRVASCSSASTQPRRPRDTPGTVSAQVDFANPRPRGSGDATGPSARRPGTASPCSQHPLGGSGGAPGSQRRKLRLRRLRDWPRSRTAREQQGWLQLWVRSPSRVGQLQLAPAGDPAPAQLRGRGGRLPGAADAAGWLRRGASSSSTRACRCRAP